METLRYCINMYNLKGFNYDSSYHITKEGYEKALQAAIANPYVAYLRVDIKRGRP